MPKSWESKWKQIRKLGNGGQGSAYLVESVEDGRQAVLKELLNNKSLVSRARMSREAANLAILNQSPLARVPKLIDHNTENFQDTKTLLYIVTEYIEGPTLQELVDRQTLDWDQAVLVMKCLIETTICAHTENILHRDLKPDNIIVKDGDICNTYVIDYGLSFNQSDAPVTGTNETIRNKFLDLPENNTPKGDRRDKRSDITALAAIMYFTLTGNNVGQLFDRSGRLPHMRDGIAVRDYLKHDTRLRAIESFFDKALSVPVENRFQTLDDFLQRIILISEDLEPIPENLAILAQSVYATLLEKDDKALHADMKRTVAQLLKSLQSAISQVNRDIKPFASAMTSFHPAQGPASAVLLSNAVHGIQMQGPMGVIANIGLSFVAEEREIVLYAQTESINDRKSSPVWHHDRWRPVFWHAQGRAASINDLNEVISKLVATFLKSLILDADNENIPSV